MININASRKCNGVGKHDQIIHFDNGEKRVIQGVLYVWENEMLHIIDYLGVEYIINKDRILFTERFSQGGEGNENIRRSRKVRVDKSSRKDKTSRKDEKGV